MLKQISKLSGTSLMLTVCFIMAIVFITMIATGGCNPAHAQQSKQHQQTQAPYFLQGNITYFETLYRTLSALRYAASRSNLPANEINPYIDTIQMFQNDFQQQFLKQDSLRNIKPQTDTTKNKKH